MSLLPQLLVMVLPQEYTVPPAAYEFTIALQLVPTPAGSDEAGALATAMWHRANGRS